MQTADSQVALDRAFELLKQSGLQPEQILQRFGEMLAKQEEVARASPTEASDEPDLRETTDQSIQGDHSEQPRDDPLQQQAGNKDYTKTYYIRAPPQPPVMPPAVRKSYDISNEPMFTSTHNLDDDQWLPTGLTRQSFVKPIRTPQQRRLCQQLLQAQTWQRICILIQEARPEDLSIVNVTTAWNRLGKLAANVSPTDQMRTLVNTLRYHTQLLMHELDGRHTAMVAHAVARLHLKDMELMRTLADRACQTEVLMTFNAQGIANLTWAFAKTGAVNLTMMDTIAERAMQDDILLTLNALGVANIIWAFATMGIQNLAFMDALANRAVHPEVLNK
eukprot:EG_transcript_18968